MKKIFLFCFIFLYSTITFAKTKEVVIFTQPNCPFCAKLKEDLSLSIVAKYPSVNFPIIDITENKDNYKKLNEYVKKYNINAREVGLPLIFVNDKYLMGWSDSNKKSFLQMLDEE